MLKLSITKRYGAVTSPACHRGHHGFTLIELMIVIVIITILAAVIYPNYQDHVRRAALAQAQQEMQKIANQLEIFKSKNFTYKNFDLKNLYNTNSSEDITTPVGSSGDTVKYKMILKDLSDPNLSLKSSSASGFGWVIKAESTDVKNYNLLMTSEGIRCKTKDSVTFTACTGSDITSW
ncbi:type IV pilin protein [Acinetobacter nematophilus]|uniref:type IV pilin protein n=1 Tax=Acinetobacter nematophilus TaxID=2994642 RepID=UPI0024080DD4|nr:prepilin-type N-terminal cleavage/methylation domain-containing protein [Acinetobacter nematophilus]